MTSLTEHTIEKTRIFPYLAWSITLGFAIFVYSLILELDAEIDALQNSLEQRQYAPLPPTPSEVESRPPAQ